MSVEEITKKLIKCVNFAAIKHQNQRRKNPNEHPYINHPIGVAYILTEEANITDDVVIQAALLHDTVEDTDTTFDEIEKEFGKEVRDVVCEVTDNKALPYHERKQLQIDLAAGCSRRAKLVKLADKLNNLRDLENIAPIGWSDDRVKEYFLWSQKVVEGLRGTSETMEKSLDEIFKRQNILHKI